ncbi:MAG: S8 family serine peptidase [Betaproteobacteria bacterium]|nr:S8 family serine peptidase [Betaproteobacteria bacterium]
MTLDLILRVSAIALLITIAAGCFRLIYWLGSDWIAPRKTALSLVVEPFEIAYGQKTDRETGRYLATQFRNHLKRIDQVLNADLRNVASAGVFQVASISSPAIELKPGLGLEVDIDFKPFNVDFIGVTKFLYKTFDRSHRLETSIRVDVDTRVLAHLKKAGADAAIGPWWIPKLSDETNAAKVLAYAFALDLYSPRISGLKGLDAAGFERFVEAIELYQQYVKSLHENAGNPDLSKLKMAQSKFSDLATKYTSTNLVFLYLGSTYELDKDLANAKLSFKHALDIDPDDQFAKTQLSNLEKATVPTPGATAASTGLENIQRQHSIRTAYNFPLPLADRASPVRIAILATGVSDALAAILGSRSISESVVGGNDAVDRNGHGTQVAALVAALAPRATVISIKVIGDDGVGLTSSIAEGIARAMDMGVHILLIPLGGGTESQAISHAIQAARKKGVLIICAAGNGSTDQPTFPASAEGAIAVGATDTSDKLASFSNYGKKVQLFAPGVDIRTMGRTGTVEVSSGTSFSAAIVAAIAAVIWSGRPELTAHELGEVMINNAQTVATSAGAPVRRVDASKAATSKGATTAAK